MADNYLSYLTFFPFYPQSLLDAGISLGGMIFGLGYALAWFVLAVFLEAWIMRKRFDHFRFLTCLKYSLLLNIVSTLIGLVILFVYDLTSVIPHTFDEAIAMTGVWIVYSVLSPIATLAVISPLMLFDFLVTIIVEAIGVILIFKPRPRIMAAVRYSIVANLASYASVFVLSFVVMVISIISHLLA